ncbi:MAG: hypothetical protein WBB29_11160 [Geitlerinemataceae cyanobacterium]
MDRRLKQLAIEAQQYLPKSLKRRLALNQLCAELLKPGCLTGSTVPSEFDRQEIYNEALSLTLMEICKKINNYNPEKEVRQWCNFIFKKRQQDIIDKYRKQGMTSIPRASSRTKSDGDRVPFSGFNDIDDLENILSSAETRSASMELRQLIEEDPDCMFSREHIRDRPDANLKFLAISHIWDDRIWSDIAEELKLPVPTIHGFFQKKFPPFYPYFREYLKH